MWIITRLDPGTREHEDTDLHLALSAEGAPPSYAYDVTSREAAERHIARTVAADDPNGSYGLAKRDGSVCTGSGRKVAKTRLRRAVYLAGRGWLAACPVCGNRPGTVRDDFRGLVFKSHAR